MQPMSGGQYAMSLLPRLIITTGASKPSDRQRLIQYAAVFDRCAPRLRPVVYPMAARKFTGPQPAPANWRARPGELRPSPEPSSTESPNTLIGPSGPGVATWSHCSCAGVHTGHAGIAGAAWAG